VKRLFLVAMATLIALPASAAPNRPAVDQAKASVLAQLKDPDSAKFGVAAEFPEAICLQVNAKNSYGGYTGNKIWVYLKATHRSFPVYPNAYDTDSEWQSALDTALRVCPSKD
jgi:hypothetical protein